MILNVIFKKIKLFYKLNFDLVKDFARDFILIKIKLSLVKIFMEIDYKEFENIKFLDQGGHSMIKTATYKGETVVIKEISLKKYKNHIFYNNEKKSLLKLKHEIHEYFTLEL
jgi:hypothetical protein